MLITSKEKGDVDEIGSKYISNGPAGRGTAVASRTNNVHYTGGNNEVTHATASERPAR